MNRLEKKLAALFERARKLPQMSEADKREQAISIAFGNVNLSRESNDQIPREVFEREYDRMHPPSKEQNE